MNDSDYTADAQKRLLDEQKRIAARLRDLADSVDRVRPTRGNGRDRTPSMIVSEITHTVLWGVANLRLDLLSSWADDVYEAERHDRESK